VIIGISLSVAKQASGVGSDLEDMIADLGEEPSVMFDINGMVWATVCPCGSRPSYLSKLG
jgi:hypothetical protein